MEATADTLLNQVANLFLSKIDQQNIDPKFLQKFTDQLLGKFSYTSSQPIKQKSTSSRKSPSRDSTRGSLVKDLKKVYKDLIKTDTTYKNDYKRFLKYVLPEELLKQSQDSVATPTKEPEIKTTATLAEKSEIKTAETSETETAPQESEGRAKMVKNAPIQQNVIFDGFTPRGWAFFSERLPKILKGIIPASKPDTSKSGSGFGLLGGGIALLLGGLAALVTGLMTDGPFKGLLKILSKVGLQGGIKMLEGAAKIFMSGLKRVIMAPINLLDDAVKLIGKVFGKGAYKAVLKPIRAMKGLFTKMLGGLVSFLKPILGKVPLIGTVISWGFAYTRFKAGDTIGGIIDVLSGIASIFPGVGTAIAIGLDVLNAFLDYKSGGANEKTTQKKTGLLKEWALGLGKILYEGAKYIPIIGPYMQAVEDMQAGKWLEASYNLVRAIPGLGILIDVLNWFTGGETEQGIKEDLSNTGSMIGDWLSWLKESIWDKITGFVTGVFDGVKDWWNNLSWDPSTWLGGEEEPTKQSKKTARGRSKIADQTNQTETLTPMADGGIVTEPTKALVGEAGPEAVLPLDKYFDPQNLSLNNTTLEQIADNTKDTNSSLKVLSDALFKLVTVLDKKMSQTGTTVINAQGQTTQQSTPASVIANINADPIRRVRMQFA
jgi:hypothetical protein